MRVLCAAVVLMVIGSPLFATGACGYRSSAPQTSWIAGVIRDAATGQPVRGVVAFAQLLSSDGQPVCYWRVATTDEAGRYHIKDLYPGSYRIGINMARVVSAEHPYPRVFFPGVLTPEQSWPVAVAQGQGKDSVDYQVPAWHVRRIAVNVRLPNGQPATGLHISMRDQNGMVTSDSNHSATTDAYGHAVVLGFVESSYEVFAEYFGVLPNGEMGRVHAEPVWVPAREDASSVDLVLETPGRYEDHEHAAHLQRQ